MNFEAVPANIMRYMLLLDISMTQMAAALGMSERSLYRRFNNPKSFTLEEVERICEECEMSLTELFEGGCR